MVEARIDVVIWPDTVSVDARVSVEEVLVANVGNGARPPKEQWGQLAKAHGSYLLRRLKVQADGVPLEGKETGPPQLPGELSDTARVGYQLEFAGAHSPKDVKIDQNLLREFDNWSVSMVVRIRQAGQPAETGLLTSDKTIQFVCDWSPGEAVVAAVDGVTTTVTAAPVQERTGIGKTIWTFLWGGIEHILTGPDHLLFVSALVLAATSFWDLIKVVSAFTLAHSVTLTLAVLHIVRVSEHIVEPMIATSIVFVAVQNVFWPRRSHGFERLAIAFGFGLFHGLGFAGGLLESMEKLPSSSLWAALISFSVGVELGHQVVVIPLFASLTTMRHAGTSTPRVVLMRKVVKTGSVLISVGGTYFLVEALRGWR
jgi:hydrogenase/urease accessory protein HupE